MKENKFVQIYKENHELYQNLLPEWINYIKEIDEHKRDVQSNDTIIQDLERRIKIQGNRKEMHFELFYCNEMLVGFANFAIDTGTLYGLLEAGYGVIMEFYISPSFRRKGYGRMLFEHIEEILKIGGTHNIYLTPDQVTGEPFWVAMGFEDTDKVDPDNNLPVYLKTISDYTK